MMMTLAEGWIPCGNPACRCRNCSWQAPLGSRMPSCRATQRLTAFRSCPPNVGFLDAWVELYAVQVRSPCQGGRELLSSVHREQMPRPSTA